MTGHHIIPLLSPLWYWGGSLSLLYIGGFLFVRRFLSNEIQEKASWMLGVFFLIFFLSSQAYLWLVSDFGDILHSLPLQLCDISQIMCIIALITKRQLAFEFALLLGMPAAMQSLATPELTHGWSGFLVFDYFFSHSTQVLAPLVLVYYAKMRPGLNSWWKVFVTVNVILAVVFCIDYLLGANYIYLMQKPGVDNPLLIGPWPWYILGVEIAGLLHIIIFYMMFRKVRMLQAQPA